jgi:AcrR family transcriptional regulator
MRDRPPRPRYSRQALYDLVWSKPLAGAATEVGLSANGLAKLCDRLMIPRPSRTYWTRPGGPPAIRAPPCRRRRAKTASRSSSGPSQFIARRARTRLSPEDRRDQLMDTAVQIILAEGLAEVTLKRVAREAGISEAQAHNCFAGRADLLASLARRELTALEQRRQLQIARGEDNLTRVILSTLGYFHEAIERGPGCRSCCATPRCATACTTSARRPPSRPGADPGFDGVALRHEPPVAYGSTVILTAVTRRAGGLLASGRTTSRWPSACACR